MPSSRHAGRALVAAVAVAAVIGHVVKAVGPDEDMPDIRRVLLRPQQLPAELERVQRGALRQLPLADFDALVARAVATDAVLRDPPRLVEARYRAVLTGEALSGSAAWTVLHRQATPGLLTLNSLSLAVRKAAWDDGTPALLGDFDVRSQAPGFELFVGRPGEQRLTVDWSARGVAEPGGLRFDLRVPACPVAVLEIDVPADREPVVPHDAGLLTGPFSGPEADRRIWRLAFAGVSQIDLAVRSAAANPSSLILARQRTHQDVSPGETACEFTFDLEAPRGGIRRLTLECDPVLRPTEVVVRNLEHWEVRAGTDEDELTRVTIYLREPLLTGAVTLRAVAPAVSDRPWASPTAAVIGAAPRGEALTIRVHPDLHFDDWRPGPFRLIQSVVTPDRWQVLSLQAGLIRTGSSRPAAWLRPAGPDFQVRERLWWGVGAGRMTLTAQLAFEVVRGPVFQVPLQLPEGWTVERVESDPPDLVAAAPPRPPQGQPLMVDLQRALGPGATSRLTVHLAHPPPAETMPFPDVLPIGARGRDGTLAVRIEPGLQSSVTDAPPADPRRPPDREPAPWGDAAPDYAYPLRSMATEGTLRIWPRPTQIRAGAVTTVTVVGVRASLACRLRLEPVAGGAETVFVNVSGSTDPWEWQVVQRGNRVRSVQRLEAPPPRMLAALSAVSPWDALTAAGLPASAAGTFWRVKLAQPLVGTVELEAHADLPISDPAVPAGEPWAVPLIRVPAAAAQDHRVTIDLRAAHDWRIEPLGMTDLPAADGSSRYRTFGYGAGPGTVALVAHDGDSTPVMDRAVLITYAADSGQLVHRLNLRLWEWDRPTVPLDLPINAVVRTLRVNGVGVGPVAVTLGAGEIHVEAPALAGARSLTVVVVYTTPGPAGGMWARLHAAGPVLPVRNTGLRRIWCLPPDVTPLWLKGWRKLPREAAKRQSAASNPENAEAPDGRTSDNADERGAEKTLLSDPGTLAGGDGMLPIDIDRGTLWEPADSAADASSVWVVHPRTLGLVGGVVAIAGLCFAATVRAWPVRCQWTALLGWLGLSAAAVVWLPEPLAAAARWPLLGGLLIASWALLRAKARPEPSTVAAVRSSAAGRVLTAGLIAVVWFGGGGRAAAPGPVIVYLVPGPAEAPGDPQAGAPRAVLAPPDLLDRLQAIGRRSPAGLDGAAWVDARYDGRVTGAQARFTAVLRLHSFADDPPPLVLPLTGVQLGSATLDGAPAFLRAAGDRYFVPVHGRGSHTLEVTFTVLCPSTGDDRELRFGVPETPISRLTLIAPPAAGHLRAVSWRGSEVVETDAGRPRLDVDLGRVGAVHVRWRAAVANVPAATVRTQETYLWDLTESDARLFGAVRFDIGPGSVTTLAVNLPKELEVAGVSVRPLDAAPGGVATGWLRNWRVSSPAAGGRRSLSLEFTAPIEGRWQVNLELVPRAPFGTTFVLPLPSAVGPRSIPPTFAWRTLGVEVSDVPPVGATPMAQDAFLRDHWLPTKVETDPRPPTRAYQWTGAGPLPAVRFLAAVGPREQATAEIDWRIGPRQAEVDATAHVTVPDGQISMVEWVVPAAVAVTSVRGPDVYRWSQTGSRLQAWLAKPAEEAEVQIIGSVNRSSAGGRFDVASIRPRAAIVDGNIRVAVRDGLTITPLQTTHLTKAAAPVGTEVSYTIDGPQPYRAAFEVRPGAGNAARSRPEDDRPVTAPGPLPRSAPPRVEFTDVEVARGDDGRWVHRARIWLTRTDSADLQVCWPNPVRLVAVDVDGRSLPNPSGPARAVSVRLSAGAQVLQLIWVGEPGGPAPIAPVAPTLTAHGEPVPTGPVLWTILAPLGTDTRGDAAPIPTAAAWLYRAAAQIRLADAARAAGPAMADAAKAARTRATIELRRADGALANVGQLSAGPNGITLNDWRQQLRDAQGPAGSVGNSLVETTETAYDDAFARGAPATWYIPAGDDGPRFLWPAPRSAWPTQLLRTAAIVLAGVLGLWWGRRHGPAAWPEQLTLLGCAAWAADGGLAWLLPAVVGVAARLTPLTGAALRRHWPNSSAAAVTQDHG